jgi:predicted double-glycine peptidase
VAASFISPSPLPAPVVVQEATTATPTNTDTVPQADTENQELNVTEPEVTEQTIIEPAVVAPEQNESNRIVPFYSQFADISAPEWRKIGCGIASLAMLIDFYEPAVPVDTLLQQGITSGAYIESAGWSHAGLIALAERYGLSGATHSLADRSMSSAFADLEDVVSEGPVMVSVHYTFQPTNPIPHLVVVTGIEDGLVYYNDPAEKAGGGSISIEQFQSAWKKRYIEIRPAS